MPYTAYNLTIHSEILLPELISQESNSAAASDITIRLGDVPPDGLPEGLQLDPSLWVTPTSLSYNFV